MVKLTIGAACWFSSSRSSSNSIMSTLINGSRRWRTWKIWRVELPSFQCWTNQTLSMILPLITMKPSAANAKWSAKAADPNSKVKISSSNIGRNPKGTTAYRIDLRLLTGPQWSTYMLTWWVPRIKCWRINFRAWVWTWWTLVIYTHMSTLRTSSMTLIHKRISKSWHKMIPCQSWMMNGNRFASLWSHHRIWLKRNLPEMTWKTTLPLSTCQLRTIQCQCQCHLRTRL